MAVPLIGTRQQRSGTEGLIVWVRGKDNDGPALGHGAVGHKRKVKDSRLHPCIFPGAAVMMAKAHRDLTLRRDSRRGRLRLEARDAD
ncbi:hypothetical protein [Brevibacterium aurantiacum]|uniref:hypothetical protein n=1 Tax=Brevibacterium aurantiacum TaxID=273384 RepID=UPI001F49D6B7|nr:hypothetical protein [Brevibacterium aurantiacum]